MSFIFLSGPYSHKNGATVHARFRVHQEAAVWAFNHGEVIYSPILHWHETALQCALPTDAESWEHYNKAMLEKCSLLRIIDMPGIEESQGTAMEMGWAANRGIPIECWSPHDLKTFQHYKAELCR